MRKKKMLIGVLTAAMLLGNVSPAMVQGAQAADVTEVPAETETEELATESAVTEVEETTETAVTETEENQPSEIAATEANEERLTEELATEAVPTETEEAATEIEVTETEEEETTEDAYKTADAKADKNGFIIEDGVLTDYTGSGGDIVIPKGVTSIGDDAFYDCDSITSVSIPKSVTSIGEGAFAWSSLKSIELSKGVTSIGNAAFAGCTNLSSITLPDGITDIEERAFAECSSLKSVVLSHGVKTIKESTFFECSSLTNISIPKSVTSIEDKAFEGCSSLTGIMLPNGLKNIGNSAFTDCSSLTDINIPDGITSIENSAFYGCSKLQAIRIPKSVTSIGDSAFERSGLKSVVIPASVTDFGDYIFSDCNELQYVTFSNGITKVLTKDGRWFSRCKKLKKITIPKSLGNIDFGRICRECYSLEMIEIDSDNQAYLAIDGIVYDKSRTKVLYCPQGFKGELIIPDGITSIEGGAFLGCSKLEAISIPESVTTIESHAFENSGLKSVVIPGSVETIEYCAFANSGLKSVVIPGSVKTIEESVFSCCTELKKVIIKDGVETIGRLAFEFCTGLTDITIPSSVTEIVDYSTAVGNLRYEPFAGCNKNNITIHCEKGSYVYGYAYGHGYKIKTDITGTNQIIIASNFTKTYGDAAFSIDAVTSGDGKLSYVSDNESVAKVDAKGKVTLTGVGTAHITITASETKNYSAAKKVITITVKKKDSAGNTDNNSNLITAKNITKTYGCKAFSLGAKSKSGGKLTYSVADKKVATVDKKGKVTVKGYGQTKITITSAAKGKYPKAKKTITLTVKPVKTRIASVKSTKSKNMVVKWKKDTKATGYVIQYSTDKKFKKGVKTVTITKNKTTSKTIGKLKGGKNYYVRVCTYKKSNGKQIKGSYSAVKSIKVKK
ncbi:MAG: leucine-rich repeat protein [Roseburia intestinalis]|nr:leucine-rich repeat protein [Roseburia intestinalis]